MILASKFWGSRVFSCHQSLWNAHTDGRRAWHAIIALVQHTQSDDVGRGMLHGPWASQTAERRRGWHVSVPLDNTHG